MINGNHIEWFWIDEDIMDQNEKERYFVAGWNAKSNPYNISITNAFDAYLVAEMNSQKPEDVKCPECGGEMISRKNSKSGQLFWGCKKYPNCRGTRDSEGKSREDREREKAEQEPLEPIDERYRFRRS